MPLVRSAAGLWLVLFLAMLPPCRGGNEKPRRRAAGRIAGGGTPPVADGQICRSDRSVREAGGEAPVAAALGLARCQAAVGEYDKALETLATAAEKHPNAAMLEAERARLAFAGGDYHTADQAVGSRA